MMLKLEPILFLVVGTCFCLIRSIICNLKSSTSYCISKSSTSYCISRTLLFVYETQSCILGLLDIPSFSMLEKINCVLNIGFEIVPKS